MDTVEWSLIQASVTGTIHRRAKVDNQDAIRWWPKAEGSYQRLAISVADGHGGGLAIRSRTGSLLAVDAARGALQEFVEYLPQGYEGKLSTYKAIAEQQLPQRIVRLWQSNVTKHQARNQIQDEELRTRHSVDVERARQALSANPYLAYGTTLLAVVVTEAFLVCLQLGDGDILYVDDEGMVTRPLARDERLIANETTSLSHQPGPHQKNLQSVDVVWRDFRVSFQPLLRSKPALVLLSTDGYSNSFVDETGYRQVATDLFQMLRTIGRREVQSNLKQWLRETTQQGSGDDITVGMFCRVDAFEP